MAVTAILQQLLWVGLGPKCARGKRQGKFLYLAGLKSVDIVPRKLTKSYDVHVTVQSLNSS